MNKSTTLLALFLGLSFIVQTTQAQNPNCQIYYLDYYDENEVCSLSEDEGNFQCQNTGNGGNPDGNQASAWLDNAQTTFSDPEFSVKNIWFFGACDCTIRLYSRENLGGCYVESETSPNDEVQQVYGESLWNRATDPQSISVTCRFEDFIA